MAFGLRRATVLGLVSVKFVSKISNLCGPIHERHRQTDRQMEDKILLLVLSSRLQIYSHHPNSQISPLA